MTTSIITSALACLALAGMAAGQPTTTMMTLVARNTTTSSSTDASQQATDHHNKLIAAIAIPVVLTILIGVLVALVSRKRRRSDAEDGAGSRSSRRTMRHRCFDVFRTNFVHEQTPATLGINADGNVGATPATTQTHRGRRSRPDRLRRTESGATVKTLPEYKTSPAENELMLYKADASPSDLELNRIDTSDTIQYSTATEHTHVVVQTDGDEGQGNESRRRHSQGPARHSSIADMAANGLSSLRRSLRRSVVGRSSSIAHPHAVETEATTDAELENLDDRHTPHSLSGPDHGDSTPTYDSLYPTVSFDAESSLEGASTPNLTLPVQANRTPNAFLDIFRRPPMFVRNAQPSSAAPPGRQRFVSNASVLSTTLEGGDRSGDALQASRSNDTPSLQLVVTTSNDASLHRPSTGQSSRRNVNPFPRFHRGNSSVSLLSGRPSLEQSSMSGHDGGNGASGTAALSHRRNISAPLSIRRLQYEPPAAGFTDEQMAFLASVESLDRYGIPLGGEGDDPVTGSRSTLPSFEQLARQQERQERQRRQQLQQQNAQLGGAADEAIARPAVVLTTGEMQQRARQAVEQQESAVPPRQTAQDQDDTTTHEETTSN